MKNMEEEKQVLRFSWKVTNLRTNEVITYSAAYGRAVSENHVRNSPSVKDWANGDPIKVSIP